MSNIYFSDLNYSLSNEDTQIEYEIMPLGANRVFSIAGSGARCLPLLAKNPVHMDIVDFSLPQLYLTELRIAATKALTYEEFLFFLGYRGALQGESTPSHHRRHLFQKLSLGEECRQYWLQNEEVWQKQGFILLGRWEKHFQKIGKIFRDYLQCDFTAIFLAQSLPEQIQLYQKMWPKWRWNAFLRIAASEYVFNKFLYQGHFSGDAKHRTEAKAPYEFIKDEFERVFLTQMLRKNYFMQILFLGRIQFEEGLPFEAHRQIYEQVQNSTTSIRYFNRDLTEALQISTYDFISLSDTISYLSPELIETLKLRLTQQTNKNARVVMRSFMRAPSNLHINGLVPLRDLELQSKKTDGTAVYHFHIYERESGANELT